MVSKELESNLHRYACSFKAVINQFSSAKLIGSQIFPLSIETFPNASFGGWKGSITTHPIKKDVYELLVKFERLQGAASNVNVGIQLAFGNWQPASYLLMPAAAYNGNRFEARAMKYPPILKDPADIGPGVPTIISDVPRLNNGSGLSQIRQMTRDLSTPSAGFYNPENSLGFWMLTDQSTRLGDSGIEFEENDQRNQAAMTLLAPGVRPVERYTIGDTHFPSQDRGADFQEGDTVELRLRLYFFDCPRLQSLFDRFVEIRKDLTGNASLQQQIPFSSAWKIQEEKYNSSNWDEQYGYYAVGLRDEFLYSHWQIGWVGGLMSTYPMLMGGNSLSRERALRTFDFVFPAGQGASGFFYGCGKEGKWFGDNFDDIRKNWLLIRKNSDAFYFLVKQFLLLQKQDSSWQTPGAWAEGTRKCADAFVRLWDQSGQFGQFVDVQMGDVIVGGSASAGIAPAGLALAWQYFGDPDYLRVAKAAGQYFYGHFVQKGYTTGGPGETLQCPDSESAFGLLESFVVLFEVTGEQHWLDKAVEQANQCITWCVSYDFQFPTGSTFGKLDMRTTGSVYANVQNKHSAPGICTLSGDSLFKLFRATGEKRYLELICEMAHNLPQYLSRSDRPISEMPAGWMNERVEMSDWLEPVGEIFYGSCWCEVSNMLVYMEVPGLYVQPDTGLVCAIDHITAEITANSADSLDVWVTNPTPFPAIVKLMVENSSETIKPLGQNALYGCQQITLETRQSIILKFKK